LSLSTEVLPRLPTDQNIASFTVSTSERYKTTVFKGANSHIIAIPTSTITTIPKGVLGDIVCGGFGMPLRRGLADDVFIVTSADYLSIYAANNICKGINRHARRDGSPLGGIVYNVRGAIDDITLVEEFAQSVGSKVIGAIPSDTTIMECEIYARTVIEQSPDSEIADIFRHLATAIYENKETVSPTPLSKEKLAELAQRIRQKTRKEHLIG